MQVKKFEAPTLQEALDAIKRELGPEAIILQTKQNRKGFGLMSKGSVEVTAAVSEKALDKKSQFEKKIPDAYSQKLNQLPADKQASVYDSYLEKRIERENVQLSKQKKRTAVRYADIQDEESQAQSPSRPAIAPKREEIIPQFAIPQHLESAVQSFANSKNESNQALREEVDHLKRLVEELRNSIQRDRNKPDFLDSDSPFAATEALQETYELLLHAGVEKRFAVQIMRETARKLSVESKADKDAVLDCVAERLLRQTASVDFHSDAIANSGQFIHVFTGSSGVGKTSMLAKLATHSARNRNDRIGVIRVQFSSDEGVDSLSVFAKALHIPYRVVSTGEELQVAIQDMSQCNRIFVDTPAVSLRDQNGISCLSEILMVVPNLNVHLVLSCTTRDLETFEQVRLYSKLHPASLLFTRMDEAFSHGLIYSVSNRTGIPVSVFSNGRKVTGDWESATPERLTASILNIL
jgi:flagellar biosynthesis protein FlhF